MLAVACSSRAVRRRVPVAVGAALLFLTGIVGGALAHLPRAAPRVDRLLALLPVRCAGDAWSGRRIVAHAGGAIGGDRYTNSREAIVSSASRGCSFQEVDFEWTSDDELVALHDWNAATLRILGPELGRRQLTRMEFLAAERRDGLTSLDLRATLAAVGSVTGAVLVPDFKWREVQAAAALQRAWSSMPTAERPEVALQVYSDEQIGLAGRLGFEREILTLYRSDLTDDEVVDLVRSGAVRALAVPSQRALGGLADRLRDDEVELFAHTVNSTWLAGRLFDRGVDGIYSDRLCGCRGAR